MTRVAGLDLLFLDPGVSGGPETVVRELGPALAAAAPAGWRLEVAASRRGGAALHAAGWGAFARVLRLPMDDDRRAAKLRAQQLTLPRVARRRRWAVLHSLANLAPVAAGVPLVLTLHDVLAMTQRTMSPASRLATAALIRAAAPRACALATLTQATRDEILRVLPVRPDRVHVVPNGAGRPPGPAEDPATVAARHGLTTRRVVLNVAAKRTHKNQALLIQALAFLPADVVVVLAGADDGEGAALGERAAAMGVRDRVVDLGYVGDAELEALYALARCVALPTRGEGFGLPVLEALRRGVPVACSDLHVLREVGGDVPAYFDPDDPAGAAAAIAAVLADRGRGARGPARAARFSWEAAAAAYWRLYEQCASV